MTETMRTQSSGIRRGATLTTDPDEAAAELFAALDQTDLALVLVFVSPRYDLPALAAALQRRFPGVLLVGCTSAGEIAPLGYMAGGITGLSLAGPDFVVACELIETLQAFNLQDGQEVVGRLLDKPARAVPQTAGGSGREQMFAFTLIDGLSGTEEAVVSALHGALGDIPLFGGSAGDDLRFKRTFILHNGEFRSDCALLVLVSTTRPFRVFKTEHFEATDRKMVVTEADPVRRIVSEIDGEPAAVEYARQVGLKGNDLTPLIFANHPVVVRVGGTSFVRSIQKVNDDGSLTFFCAIDEGIVLTVARGVDLAENLRAQFAQLEADVGRPALVIGFDCILRALELDEKNIRNEVGRLMSGHNVIGFSTYGEQFHAMHVNQTFTGVAIGYGDGEAGA